MTKDQAKNRLIAASLRVAAAERGGLDMQNTDDELNNANEIFEDAVADYVTAANGG